MVTTCAGSISEGFKIKAAIPNIKKVNGILFMLHEGLKGDTVKLT